MPSTSFGVLRLAARWATLPLLLVAVGCGRSDTDTQEAVRTELERDPITEPFALDVEVDGGVVSISGKTQTVEQQERALEVARAVEGVTEVKNGMVLQDRVLVDAVSKALAEDALLAAVPIKVDFGDGKVRLMSDQTDSAQRERAMDIAKSIAGVQGVEDRMK